MQPRLIPISFSHPDLAKQAQLLATQYGFPLDEAKLPRLNLTMDHLELLSAHFSPMKIEFGRQQWQSRRDAGKKQGLVQACKPRPGLRIIDATAGWGRDAAILASFGAEVLMIERQPTMAALLEDALQRMLRQDTQSLPLKLIYDDAIQVLQSLMLADYPDVIYLDPMHPTREKSALVKKDMQLLQHLLGADQDVLALLNIARQKSKQRTVIKWPQRLPALQKPNFSLAGKTVRFDIYLSDKQR